MVWAWYFPEDSKEEQVAIFFNIVVKQKRQLGGGDFYKINFAQAGFAVLIDDCCGLLAEKEYILSKQPWHAQRPIMFNSAGEIEKIEQYFAELFK